VIFVPGEVRENFTWGGRQLYGSILDGRISGSSRGVDKNWQNGDQDDS
jgi:hypothetical protein